MGNKRYLLVGTDYFIKWVEVEPLANIRDVDAKKFVWKVLSPGLGSFVPSVRTMAFSLITNLLGDIVMTWELRIDILAQLIPKEMDKPGLLTRS